MSLDCEDDYIYIYFDDTKKYKISATGIQRFNSIINNIIENDQTIINDENGIHIQYGTKRAFEYTIKYIETYAEQDEPAEPPAPLEADINKYFVGTMFEPLLQVSIENGRFIAECLVLAHYLNMKTYTNKLGAILCSYLREMSYETIEEMDIFPRVPYV